MIFKVDTSKVVALTNRLEKLNRSAFPIAVRGTLNDAAYDVKTNTMPTESRTDFEHRQQNFFKANSKYIKAEGFNLKTMQSDVGFYENKLKNQGSNYAVKDLEEQEAGGQIKKKAFIPVGENGGPRKSNVRPNARLSAIKKIANRGNVKGGSWAQQMIKSAVHVGVGGFLLTEQFEKFRGGALFRIKSIIRKGKNTSFVAEKLYSFKKGRTIIVKPTHFMKDASMHSANKMDDFYINQALRQFKKAGIIK